MKSHPNPNFAPGIKFRLFLLGLIPVGISLFSLVAYYVYNQSVDLDSALRQHGNTIARRLASAATTDTKNHNIASLQHLADSYLTEADVITVRILNNAGQVLVSAQHPGQGNKDAYIVFEKFIISPKFFPIVPEPPQTTHAFEPSRKDFGYKAQSPQVLGTVQIYLSNSATLKNQRTFLLNSLLIAFTGLAVAFLFVFFIGRRISAPIFDVIQTVSAITKGNLAARVEYSGDLEMRALQRGLNTMAASLQKNQAHLERRIYTATIRLQDTLRSIEEKNNKLEEARRQAEKQNKTKSQFLAHVSHEIRTPMNGILGFVELLSKSELNSKQLDQLNLIEESAKNLLTIINEILDLSKLESGEFTLTQSTYNLRNYLEDTVSLLCPQHDHLEIILYIDPGFPTLIKGDPIRLQQIITNLLGNALKFTATGRIVIRARRFCIHKKDHALLSVSDTGRGIAEADQKKLFSPFLGLSDFDVNYHQGTGLGLAISKNIIERMNGSIGVISRPGIGSTFWIKFPLVAEQTPLPGKINIAVAIVNGSILSQNALESQLLALGIMSKRFDSVERLIQSTNRWHARVNAVTILIVNADNRSNQIQKMVEALRTHFNTPILLAGNSQHTNTLKECTESHANGYVTLPCRSSFLFNSLNGLNQKPETKETEDIIAPKNALSCINRTFLVSDDNEINRVLLKSQLLQTGAVVLEAKDGKESIELLNAVAFDLIFLDLQMPVMNGMDIMRYIAENQNINKKTPVIAVTAHALPHQRKVVLKAGFADCLIKPLLQSQLLQTLEKYVGQTQNLVANEDPSPDTDTETEAEQLVKALLVKTNGDLELTNRLFTQLFQEIPEQLQIIEHSIHDSNWDIARQITHKLNGSLSFCKIDKVKKDAARLENALSEGIDKSLINQNLQRLKTHIEELLSIKRGIFAAIEQHSLTTTSGSSH